MTYPIFSSRPAPEVALQDVLAALMIVMGLAIAGIWTRDIAVGDKVDLSAGLFAARDADGSLLWPHWLAEYTTAFALVVGAAGLLIDSRWGSPAAALALGALFYTSTNSLGWAFAERERFSYAAPMTAGIVVSLVGAIHLLFG